MSICNVFVSPFYALLAVDTQAALIDPHHGGMQYREVQKASIHGTVVVGGRGNLAIVQAFQQSLAAEMQLWTIDHLLLDLEGRCAAAEAAFEAFRGQHLPGTAVPALAAGCEVMVVGWSAGLQKMRAAVATLPATGGPWEVEAIDTICAAPGVWPAKTLPDLGSPAAMQRAAAEQVAGFRQQYPGAPIGGHLLVHEVTPDRIDVRRLELLASRKPLY